MERLLNPHFSTRIRDFLFIGIMKLQSLKKFFLKDRRSYHRRLVKCNFDLEIPTKEGTTIKRKADVIDISFGGAAFIYEGSPDDLANSGFFSFSKYLPATIRFKTASDVECSAESIYRRRGIKFNYTTILAKRQIIEFIKEYGE